MPFHAFSGGYAWTVTLRCREGARLAKGIASKCDFQRIHSNGLTLNIKPFTMNTRTVARRDLDLGPILAAFAPFFAEESAIAERRR